MSDTSLRRRPGNENPPRRRPRARRRQRRPTRAGNGCRGLRDLTGATHLLRHPVRCNDLDRPGDDRRWAAVGKRRERRSFEERQHGLETRSGSSPGRPRVSAGCGRKRRWRAATASPPRRATSGRCGRSSTATGIRFCQLRRRRAWDKKPPSMRQSARRSPGSGGSTWRSTMLATACSGPLRKSARLTPGRRWRRTSSARCG